MQRIFVVNGREEDINTISKFLRHIEYLGHVGASRNLLVSVDGDGSGRISVTDDKGKHIDEEKYNIKQETKTIGAISGIYNIG